MTTAGGINPYRTMQNPYAMGVPSAGMGVPITGGSPYGVPSSGVPAQGIPTMSAPSMFPGQGFSNQGGFSSQDMLGMMTSMASMIASTMSMMMQLLPMLLGQQQQQPGGVSSQLPGASSLPTGSMPAVGPKTSQPVESNTGSKGTSSKSPGTSSVPTEPMGDDVDAKETVTGVKATGYYPADDPVEGGFNDMKGKKLNTLQDFLDGKADYVSVAMDNKNTWKYGTEFRIPELEKKYGRKIKFKLVDTGGAFYGKGKKRIDICVRNQQSSYDSGVNGNLTLQVTKMA